MNFMGKIGFNAEDKEENKQPHIAADRWLPSSSPSYHQHHSHQLQQPFLSAPTYQHHHNRDGWLLDNNGPIGEPSSNHNEEERGMMVEREHMFDKVVTPSDVGKLNRLVIPKQHAERYFPLDSSTNDKGLLLNFEDMNGKVWRFRYSYWNSSQSYVMTKGWSRFVKEKKLDAGDIVSFQQGVGVTSKDRLFIDCRHHLNSSSLSHQLSSSTLSLMHPWNPLVLQSFPTRKNPNFILQPPISNYPYTSNLDMSNVNKDRSRSVYVEPSGFGTPQQQAQMMQGSGFGFGVEVGFDPQVPSPAQPVHGISSSKRLRLFGVNMDCPFPEEKNDQDQRKYQFYYNKTLSPSLSSSVSAIPYLQLRPYGGGTECNLSMIPSPSSSTHDFNIIAKSTNCNVSLNLDI